MDGSKKPKVSRIVPIAPATGKIVVTPGKLVARQVLNFKKVWFTSHALDRMKQRGVAEKEVFAVLDNPDKKALPTEPRRFRWRKGGVDVIFEKWKEKLAIITVIK